MNKREYIYGRNSVAEVLQSERKVYTLYINETMKVHDSGEFTELARKKKVTVRSVKRQELDRLADGTHQGVVAEVEAYRYANMEELFALAKARDEQPFFILLDGLEDSRNLGAIMRTVDAIGAHGIIIPKHRSVHVNTAAMKTATGAAEHVKVVQVTNLVKTMRQLKKDGLWFVATDAHAQSDYRQERYDMPTCLVIGSEGAGISRLVLEESDLLVKMPMVGHVNSLNASVAAALLMYEVYNQRNPVATKK
ncbi:MAG: 23S rRNA (guanosine(2251)-2'-O)-methyltransferase RlmB [Culicoidibacterales bacterium]